MVKWQSDQLVIRLCRENAELCQHATASILGRTAGHKKGKQEQQSKEGPPTHINKRTLWDCSHLGTGYSSWLLRHSQSWLIKNHHRFSAPTLYLFILLISVNLSNCVSNAIHVRASTGSEYNRFWRTHFRHLSLKWSALYSRIVIPGECRERFIPAPIISSYFLEALSQTSCAE